MPASSLPAPETAEPAAAEISAPYREKLTAARIIDMRELVEGTSLPFRRIAERLGVSSATVCRYAAQEGWQRPPGAALPARHGTRRERVTEKLWKLTERHAEALEDQPLELAQRSLQPLARLTRVLGDMEKIAPRPHRHRDEPDFAPESQDRSLHELHNELQAHLDRIMEEEGYGWEVREWWFENGGGI